VSSVPAADPPAHPRDRPIGVFASGVGGLTVLHELLVHLPQEDFVYLADTARFPYGARSRAELERYSLEIAEELVRRRVKLLVVACNSAASAALPALTARMMQTTLGVDVIGVVRPGAVHAVAATRNGRVGLLATRATVDSGAYREALGLVDPHVELTEVPCPDLAEQVERGAYDAETLASVRAACEPLKAAGVDTVILGCTHYPLLTPMLQRTLGPEVAIVSSGAPMARSVEHVLGARGLAAGRCAEGEYRFLTTGDPEPFAAMGSRFLQLPLGVVDRVELSPTLHQETLA
jgi:glutamate racemase